MIWHFPIPLALWLLAAAVVVVALIPGLLNRIAASGISWIFVGGLVWAGSLLLPSQNHLMGDGLTHLGATERVFSATEPLDIFLHHITYTLVGSTGLSYRIIAAVSCVAFLVALYLITRLFATALERALVGLSFLATATLQFYFGYVESYTLLHVFTLYFIYFAWRDLARETISYLPLLFFLLALVSHFSGITLLPAVIYLYRRRLGANVWLIAAIVAVAGLIVAVSANITKVVLPLWPNDYSAYALFSSAHLLDLLNVLLLATPAFFLVFWPGRLDRRQHFTLIALGGALLFTILVDPKIGAFRDWDLLSIFAVPLVALIALRAPRRPWTVAILAAVICLRIIPWLLFNSQLQIEAVKSHVLADLHYSEHYDQGQRLESWGLLLERLGDQKGAAQAWQRRLEILPNDISTISMLAPLQFIMKDYPAAYRNYVTLMANRPEDGEYLYKAAYSAFLANRPADAMALLNQVPPEQRGDPKLVTLYAGLAARQGNHQMAVDLIRRTPLTVADPTLPYLLAVSALRVGDSAYAREILNAALSIDTAFAAARALRDSL